MKGYFSINNQFKKYLPIFLIMLSVIILMGTSYSLLRNSQRGENSYAMNIGVLEVTFQDSETNELTLTDAIPLKDIEGIESEKELVFTVKNTGTIAASYNIYIEETSTNPEFKTVIKYISNKDEEGYTNPKVLSEDKYINQNQNIEVEQTDTYKVKVWLSEEADATYMNKTFTARVVIEVNQIENNAFNAIKTKLSTRPNTYITDTDGIIYISGAKDDGDATTTDDIDFNYVWYSGKLWRITQINPDGTMKMITDGLITSIKYGSLDFYTDMQNKSYAYQWLNEDFLDTLYNYENIIVTDALWNATRGDYGVNEKIPETTMVSANVGLLNTYEYYQTYNKLGAELYENGYLNIGYEWWLLNHKSGAICNYVSVSGDITSSSTPYTFSFGLRPVVKLKSTIKLSGGTGTKDDPYKIVGDKEKAVAHTTLLNTRSSGEYVRFNGEKYRIVGIENNTTKLNKIDYISSSGAVVTKVLSSSATYGSGTSDSHWDYYLNNTWKTGLKDAYESMLVEGTYYLGEVTDNYKSAICESASNTVTTKNCTITSNTWTGYIGLPRYGEMFASQLGTGNEETSEGIWLITPWDSSTGWSINNYGDVGTAEPSVDLFAARQSIHMKSDATIIGGSGTENDPYVVVEEVTNYSYSSSNKYYTYTVRTSGKYKVQLWGARGGKGRKDGAQTYAAGYGGYTEGIVEMTQGEILYFYVGGVGGSPSDAKAGGTAGYNGGGAGGADSNYTSSGGNEPGGGGGGATDVRYFGSTTPTSSELTWNSTLGLNSRIMIAGGGGGSSYSSKGGYGGGLKGGAGTASSATVGSQTGGNAFGTGGSGSGSFTGGPGGGGGGYYGGKAGQDNGDSGAGGSAFISGHTGSVAITSSSSRTARKGTNGASCANGTTDNLCSVHYSGKVFTSTVIKAGNASMPSTSGATETGHNGSGYARITYLGE